jgi:Ni,Fe-hydrogenase I large subunit
MSIITNDEVADAAECATTRFRGAELIVRDRNGIAGTAYEPGTEFIDA